MALKNKKKISKEKSRCWWCGEDPLYVKYHDTEWGVPVHDDRKLFEFLILEGFQAGLSWITILRKRENFRKAFSKFNPKKVARYTARDFKKLMSNAGIIRNRAKIKAATTNAKLFLEVQKEFGTFDKFIWQFTKGKTIRVAGGVTHGNIRATSPESDAMSKELKRRGFKFVGSTICYAHMQATGMVDDHARDCFKSKTKGKVK